MLHFLEGCKASFFVNINSYIGIFDLNRKLLNCKKRNKKKIVKKIRRFRNPENMWWAWPLSFAFSNEVHRRSCHCRVPDPPGVPPGPPSMLVAPQKWETSRLSSSENSVVTCDPTVLPGCSAITKIQERYMEYQGLTSHCALWFLLKQLTLLSIRGEEAD